MAQQQDFVFVTYTEKPGTVSRDPSTKGIVRKQALKAHYSAQGSNLTAERQRESSAVTGRPRRQHMGRFRLPKTTAQSKPEDASPKLGQSVHALDPFVSSLGGHAWELLDYCEYTLCATNAPGETDPRKSASHSA
jgi:hypothetical protein